jgi:Superfamily II helicase and inactivated derivatives
MEVNNKKHLVVNSELLMGGKEYKIGDYTLNGNGLYLPMNVDGKVQDVKMCEPICIEKTIANIDTKEAYIRLLYKYQGTYNTINVTMGMLQANKISKLLNYGVDIPPEDDKFIARHLMKQLKLVEHEYIYNSVGWHFDKSKNLEFRLNELVSNNPNIKAINNPEDPTFNLSCSGTLEAWTDMFHSEIKGNTPLEAMMCIGFSAPIVGYLYRKDKHTDTLMFHISGKSTTGKTTVSKAAVSPFGVPDTKDKGLFRTWNGTTNAIINSLGGNFGIPLVFDEFSMVKNRDISKEIYTIASGEDKARLTDTITQRKVSKWGTTIISTGEQSIFERANNNGGLRVRTFVFEGVKWTESAENAENIKAVISENYGHAGVEFIKYIFNQGFSIIDEKWDYWKAKCLEVMPDNPFKNRVADKFAIIMTGGEIANEALGLGIDLEAVLNFLVNNEIESIEDRDIGEKAFTDIIQLINQKVSKFKLKDNSFTPRDCWGKINSELTFYKVAVIKNVLEKQLRELNYEDVKVVIKEWKEKDYLITEVGKNTNRITVNTKGKRDTVYILKIPREELREYVVNSQPNQVG